MPDAIEHRKKIEPWLSAIFQSEHLSLLIGAGMSTGLSYMAGIQAQGMGRLNIPAPFGDLIRRSADRSASAMERGEANLEDDVRIALELIRGYQILDDEDNFNRLVGHLNESLSVFIRSVLATEHSFVQKLSSANEAEQSQAQLALRYLNSFLLSFSSRAASRERLNIFTTNYDRFIEFGCDESGIILLDRFKGKLQPIFRNTRLELDYHYNPPGIRGEPRYVEGVARITKLHGSLDWRFVSHGKIVRELLPFGAAANHPGLPATPTNQVVIYPNSAKDVETAFYPYSELFRDFSSAICRPNSSIVTYGYGFGDSHINRTIGDMFTIPSTHLVIIAYGDPGDKIRKFLNDKNPAQYTLLMGNHFGDLKTLVDNYLPKSAIDRLTIKMRELQSRRDGFIQNDRPTAVATEILQAPQPTVNGTDV